MDGKLNALLKAIADTVPFVLEVHVKVEENWRLAVTFELMCLDDVWVRECLDMESIAMVPHAVLCEQLYRQVLHARMEAQEATWQAMKKDAQHGIGICHAGDWSTQRRIDWPPPPFLDALSPCDALTSHIHRLLLHSHNTLTRVAQYREALFYER